MMFAGVAAGAAVAHPTKPLVVAPGGEYVVGAVFLSAAVGSVGYSVATAETIDGHEYSKTFGRPVPPTPPVDSWEFPDGTELSLPTPVKCTRLSMATTAASARNTSKTRISLEEIAGVDVATIVELEANE